MSMLAVTRADITTRLLDVKGKEFDVALWDRAVETCAKDVLVGRRPRFRAILAKVLLGRWRKVPVDAARHMVATGPKIGLSLFPLVTSAYAFDAGSLDKEARRLQAIGVSLAAVAAEEVAGFFNQGSWQGRMYCHRLALCLRLGMPVDLARGQINGAAALFDALEVK